MMHMAASTGREEEGAAREAEEAKETGKAAGKR
jgi:hypothetical protein